MNQNRARVEDIGALRAQLRGNPQFRLEVLAALIRIARDHGIALSDGLLEHVTFADEAELDLMLAPDVKGLEAKRTQAG
jgi:hypothetical protein